MVASGKDSLSHDLKEMEESESVLDTDLRIVGFFVFFIYIIYLFLAALGLCCFTQAFFSCGEQGLLFVVVHGLLIAVASLVPELGF